MRSPARRSRSSPPFRAQRATASRRRSASTAFRSTSSTPRGCASTADEVEQIGIERTLAEIARADAVLHLVDATHPDRDEDVMRQVEARVGRGRAGPHGAEQDRPDRAAARVGGVARVAIGEERRRGRSAARRTEAHRRMGARHHGREPDPRARAPGRRRSSARASTWAPPRRTLRSATRCSTCSPKNCGSPAIRSLKSPANSPPTTCSASSSAGSASGSSRTQRSGVAPASVILGTPRAWGVLRRSTTSQNLED